MLALCHVHGRATIAILRLVMCGFQILLIHCGGVGVGVHDTGERG